MVEVRYVLTRRHPPASRILVVESGSRHVLERLLPALDRNYPKPPADRYPDLSPGYSGELRSGARPDFPCPRTIAAAAARRRLFRELKNRRPDICGLLCTGAPIMTAWKWLTAWRMPSKVFLVNENSDYFWLDPWPLAHTPQFRDAAGGVGQRRCLVADRRGPVAASHVYVPAALRRASPLQEVVENGMKAIFVTEPGGVDKLRYEDLPVPEPGPGQALVKLHFSGRQFH